MPSRRRFLQSAGSVAAVWPCDRRSVSPRGEPRRHRAARALHGRRARPGAAGAGGCVECKHRILDTLGAMVSGSRMKPGEMALKYVRTLGGDAAGLRGRLRFPHHGGQRGAWRTRCARMPTRPTISSPSPRRIPGCSVVPAALAIGERRASQRTGVHSRRRARLRSDLPAADGAGSRSRARLASQRGGDVLDLRRARRGRIAGAARREGDALRDLLFGAAGVRPVELGEGQGPHREGVRLRRHGRAQRRHGRRHGAERD